MVVTDVRAGKPQALRFTPLTPAGDSMIRVAYAQRSLVEVLLPDGEKLWDPVLRRVDAELEDEGLLDVMVEALGRRRPLSSRRGRPGTPATVALRMLVLKHLSDWSFDECEREVRANLVYRAFCRVKRAFDPLGILNPGIVLPSGEPPISQLKVGADAAPLPSDIARALREIELNGGYARCRLELA